MFIPKCKKCGGKVISAYTNIEIETKRYGKIRNSKTSRYSVRNVGKKP